MSKRCPGMDPGRFKPEDIACKPYSGCGSPVGVWKDDALPSCAVCGEKNTDARMKDTCLAQKRTPRASSTRVSNAGASGA